jgi:hypothetical protein
VKISRETEPKTHQIPGLWSRLSQSRWPLVLTLGTLLIGAVALLTQVWWASTAAAEGALAPITPAPFAATPQPPSTPTPSVPQLGDPLETLYIDIAPREFAQLEAKRAESLETWILLTSADDFVRATVRLGEQTYAARLRLKGDWADHIASDKWSFRIELRDDGFLYGMRTFSIHDPSARVYLNEYTFLRNLRDEDVLGVHYDFLHVVVNGEYKGIYALEEAFAKELLEMQGRREGVIIRYAEDLIWRAWASYDDRTVPPGIERFYIIDEFGSGRVDRSEVLSAQRDTAVGLLRGFDSGKLSALEVFDLERTGKFLALADLWSATHGLNWHNLRYYYNPVTTRLEPIAFDSDPFSPELDFEQVGLRPEHFNKDPYLQAAYARALWEVSQPGYVEALEDRLGADAARLRAAMEPEFGPEVLAPPWELLRRRQELNRQRLSPIQTTYAYRLRPADLSATPVASDTLVLEIGNLMDVPVEVVGLRVNGVETPVSSSWLTTSSSPYVVHPPPDAPEVLVLRALAPDAAALPYVRLTAPFTATADAGVELLTRVWGLTQTLTQTVIPSYPLPLSAGPRPSAPTLAEVLRIHPYLQPAAEAHWLTIPAGSWTVSGTLVLPPGYGLQLGPGTTLRFGAEDFLLSSGPLRFHGTAEAPVVLQPVGEVWRGIAVLDAGEPSSWQHVIVADTDAIMREGWVFTGGVTFHRSPVHISHTRFLGTRAEDALNIIRSTFHMSDSEFADTASDAFDGDFAEGTVERCIFRNVAADGIDVSGSDVTVRDVRFYNLGDKALSIGEASRVTATGIFVDTADFALASKDGSYLAASHVVVRNIDIAALAAFTKKPAYGPATLIVDDIDFGDIASDKHVLVQTGSTIDLDGHRIWGTEVDVDALYEKWR